ncbi:MAG: GNAT family N-acetyltransferase [Actinomycetota bacterium]|nr:GNAT family N-acetyltransferase [Actinomycetota bacterium]
MTAEPLGARPDPPRMSRTGDRVRLREAMSTDAALLDRWDADRGHWRGQFNDFGPDRPTPAPAELLRAGERLVGADHGRVLVERMDDGEVIGSVGWHAVRYGPNAASTAWNIGISLVPDARGHGFGAEAQRLAARMLLEATGVGRVEASTDVANVAEQRALHKAGFVREGVLRRAQHRGGAWHDLVLFSVVRADLDDAGPG